MSVKKINQESRTTVNSVTKSPDLKSTLNLPRTAFSMKANLPQSEPRQLAEWEEKGLYQRIQQARAGAEPYVLHDGPPYPTGTIHLGTGLNKILKDMVVKSKTMAGFRAPYVPGWDCHGLPIETQVEKELEGGKGSVSGAEFRRRCREFALRYVEQHRRDFKRLGILGQWENPYLTMSNQYEARIADTFLTFLERGYVYRGLKPVYWCIFDSTALAEAEVEYENHTSPQVWVKFAVADSVAAAKLGEKVSAVIWTTTPWTLPHNRALAFHPEYDYVVVESKAGPLLIAEERMGDPEVRKNLGLEEGRFRRVGKGRELEGLLFQHPFLDLRVPAVMADYVTLDQGTGIVHTAPGHGAEDFYTGQKYGLEIYAPLDDQGRFLEGLPQYKGKTVFEANPRIVALLRERGALLAEGKLTHSYPHCWRCHNPVIFRATEQWFINLEHQRLRQRALEEIRKVKWTPEWGEERIYAMIAERPDWCISRQRVWGVPLVIFYCETCHERLANFQALRNVVRWFEREGADAWYQHSAEELLPPGVRCKCGGSRWRKETDILDVWFDSGSSHLAVLDAPGTPNRNGLPWPADLYLEGPDQYRGWFHSSLLIGVGAANAAPYRHVLTHGWTLDEHGRPMSKSLGNVVEPREICQKWGADLLRLWVAAQDYTADVRMSDRVMTQLSEAYRKIRNTFRFALSNLADFDLAGDALPHEQLDEFDRWMLQRTAELVKQCRGWYDAFEFHRVFHALHDFCVVDLSAFYFDILKDRLYTFAPRGRARRSAQTAIYRIANALVRLVAPILAFTAEEIWKHMPRRPGEPDSVHMALFPAAEEIDTHLDPGTSANWNLLQVLRGRVLRSLEEARNDKLISGSLEAKVVLEAGGDLVTLLHKYARALPALFIVSQVEIAEKKPVSVTTAEDASMPVVRILRADGRKCERCWNYSTRVGESAEYPTVCERCLPVVKEILGGGPATTS
ncbi:MAG: isoleucine--tRNA ligase [Acidobacteria bacterium]|nr:MAG: isoleucine--tRNA ligase [Acidobacteriota bacterium]